MKRLTIIIPFLLEKEELEQTLENMYQHLEEEIDLILINDASDDGYDYKSVADKYGALYIENEERIGVAASRDKGVELCQTPYFLLLDAHMRFYDHTWLDRIVEELEKDSRLLLCTQTRFLTRKDGVLIEPQSNSDTLGAYIPSSTNIMGSLHGTVSGSSLYVNHTENYSVWQGISKENALAMTQGISGAKWCCDNCASASWYNK